MIGWVFFRSPTPAYALKYLGTLAGLYQGVAAVISKQGLRAEPVVAALEQALGGAPAAETPVGEGAP